MLKTQAQVKNIEPLHYSTHPDGSSAFCPSNTRRRLTTHIYRIGATQLTQAVTELWAASVFFAKLSLLLVYHRYFEVRYVRVGVQACAVFFMLLFVAMIVVGEVDCLPFEEKWDVAAIEGWCGRAQEHFIVTSSSLHAFSDLFILCLPIPCIWGLDLRRRKKIALIRLFSGGLV